MGCFTCQKNFNDHHTTFYVLANVQVIEFLCMFLSQSNYFLFSVDNVFWMILLLCYYYSFVIFIIFSIKFLLVVDADIFPFYHNFPKYCKNYLKKG